MPESERRDDVRFHGNWRDVTEVEFVDRETVLQCLAAYVDRQSGLANTRIERTIGAGILVKERRGLAPLAAEAPCWADTTGGSVCGGPR